MDARFFMFLCMSRRFDFSFDYVLKLFFQIIWGIRGVTPLTSGLLQQIRCLLYMGHKLILAVLISLFFATIVFQIMRLFCIY
jgi:hypothetical protein